MIKHLSIIFPIYNEEKRLKKGFQQIKKFISKNKNKIIEIIIVNDGSSDNSKNLLNIFKSSFTNNYNSKLKIVTLKKNIGKGGAIYAGLKYVNSNLVLTVDIDMSVRLEQLIIWQRKFPKMNFNKDVFFGSRAHSLSKVKRQIFRGVIGYLMRIIVQTLFGIKIKDTQCGFKLYPTFIAKKVFKKLLRPRYEHDIEIVLRLIKKKIKIYEMPVFWIHKNFSKVNILFDSVRMFIGLILLKIKYL